MNYEKILETSKGKFIVTDDLDKINNWMNNGKYEYICMLKRCEEKDASIIVDESFNAYNEHSFVYYGGYLFSGCHIVTAIQSLHSLLKSQGIEITNNTYIFKI